LAIAQARVLQAALPAWAAQLQAQALALALPADVNQLRGKLAGATHLSSTLSVTTARSCST
jgi:hypothetical protein